MVKIDTRRLQDKKKKHFEYDCESRNEKKDKYGKRRSRTKVFRMFLIEEVCFWSVGVGWMGGRR